MRRHLGKYDSGGAFVIEEFGMQDSTVRHTDRREQRLNRDIGRYAAEVDDGPIIAPVTRRLAIRDEQASRLIDAGTRSIIGLLAGGLQKSSIINFLARLVHYHLILWFAHFAQGLVPCLSPCRCGPPPSPILAGLLLSHGTALDAAAIPGLVPRSGLLETGHRQQTFRARIRSQSGRA